jgi:glutaredoxin 3
MAGANRFVDEKIRQRKVMMFSKRGDPACLMASQILDTYGLSPKTYEVCEIEQRQDCSRIENHFLVICLTSNRCVPRLFVNGQYVGSEPEIRRLHEAGTLGAILTESGHTGMAGLPCLDNSQSVYSMGPCGYRPGQDILPDRQLDPNTGLACLDTTQSVFSVGPC